MDWSTYSHPTSNKSADPTSGNVHTMKHSRGMVRLSMVGVALLGAWVAVGQTPATLSSIEQKIGTLRGLPDDVRAKTTMQLALDIRALPAGSNKVMAASGLTNLSTEGDFGRDTLQAVTDTLVGALKETPQPPANGQPFYGYTQVAQLARFEGMNVNLPGAEYAAAVAQLNETEKVRATVDFTLKDLDGKSWTLSSLKGKVVVVNFWATWCPPCRKEMPDLEILSKRFKDKGLVVLAISDEEAVKTVKPFIDKNGYTFPILIDTGRTVNDKYKVDGIPKTFIYDRKGKLAAESIDMRTQGQFLKLLAKAGLK